MIFYTNTTGKTVARKIIYVRNVLHIISSVLFLPIENYVLIFCMSWKNGNKGGSSRILNTYTPDRKMLKMFSRFKHFSWLNLVRMKTLTLIFTYQTTQLIPSNNYQMTIFGRKNKQFCLPTENGHLEIKTLIRVLIQWVGVWV